MNKLLVASLLVIVLCVGLSTSALSSITKKKIEDCHKHCTTVRKHGARHCELYCVGGHTNPKTLTILEDGVPITETMSASEMTRLSLPQVRFDKALFNTPSAFDEFVQWSEALKQQVAVASEGVFGAGGQFHLLAMPIPLTSDQLQSREFMNRLVDVVPANNLIYKETSPLTFSEAYRQFLLDLHIDQSQIQGGQSAETLARIRQMEAVIANDMNAFLDNGDKCYAAYEQHLIANNLKKIAYTFDTFGPTNHFCVQADQHMANHEAHSKELADYLKAANPHDELFRNIGDMTSMRQDWNINVDTIRQFTAEQVHYENSGSSPNRFQIILNMMRYYFKQEYFGSTTKLEESCLNAHVDFNGLGWREIPVSPNSWYNEALLQRYRQHPTNSNKNYFGADGLLQRRITKVIVAYKPTLKITISKAMKEQFVEQSLRRNMRALEFGPYVYDKIEFNANSGVGLVDTYQMILSASTQDPQIIGYKTESYVPLSIARISTDQFAFCRQEAACDIRKINLVPIHRYAATNHHFYTSNFNELGGGGNGWTYEGIQGYCHADQYEGTTPLYRYSHPRNGKHFYTTNWGELGGGRDGWAYEGVVCYVNPSQVAGTVPWHRFSHPHTGDHLYTTNHGEVQTQLQPNQIRGIFAVLFQKLLWKYEGIAGYIHSQSALDKAISCCKCN